MATDERMSLIMASKNHGKRLFWCCSTALEGATMGHRIYTDCTASIGELRANPVRLVREADGPVVILSRNKPAFYCVPAEDYEVMMRRLEDFELAEIARERLAENAATTGQN